MDNESDSEQIHSFAYDLFLLLRKLFDEKDATLFGSIDWDYLALSKSVTSNPNTVILLSNLINRMTQIEIKTTSTPRPQQALDMLGVMYTIRMLILVPINNHPLLSETKTSDQAASIVRRIEDVLINNLDYNLTHKESRKLNEVIKYYLGTEH